MENQGDKNVRIWLDVSEFKDEGSESLAKECRWSLETQKDKKMDSTLKTALLTPRFELSEIHFRHLNAKLQDNKFV